MVEPDHITAIAIEGIGREGAPSNPLPLLFTTSPTEVSSSTLLFDVWPYLRLDSLGGVDTTADIFRAKTTWGGFDFHVEASPDKVPERLFYEQRRADATLQEGIAAGASTLKLDNPNLANTVVYIDEETMVLGSATGTSGGVTTYNVDTLAAYQSKDQAHGAEANVFTSVPYWGGRRVWLYTMTRDVTDTLGYAFEQRQICRISGSFRQSNGAIIIPTEEVGSGLDEVQRGRAQRSFERLSQSYYFRDGDDAPIRAATTSKGDYTPKIAKPTSGSGQENIAFEVDGQIVPGFADRESGPAYTGTTYFSGSPIFGQKYSEDKWADTQTERKIDPSVVNEVFVADRIYSGLNLNKFSIDVDTEPYQWHPLAFYGCFHLSQPATPWDPEKFDVLKPDWSLNLDWLFVDDIIDRLWELIRQTPNQKIDRIILGTGGEPVTLRQYCREALLRPYGWTEGITNDGKLTVQPLKDTDVEFYDNALDNRVRPEPSETLDLSNGRGSTVDAVEAVMGSEFLGDRRSILVQARDNSSTRPADLTSSPDLSYDLSTIDPERIQWVRSQVVSKLLQQHFALPRLRVRVPDHTFDNLDYGVVSKVALEDLDVEPAWLLDKDGNRVSSVGDDVQFAGYIVSRRFMPRERAYELELLLTGSGLIRWRTPSGVIESVSGTGTSSQDLVLGGGGASDTAFGDEDTTAGGLTGSEVADASRFTAGDEVQIWKPDGTQWNTEIVEVASVSGDTVTLDGSFSSAPPTGYIVELAHLRTSSGSGYENDGLGGTFDFVDRAYFYLADASDTLGDANLDADEYGT